MKLSTILENATNIAEKLDEETLTKIGHDCVEGYNMDIQSRQGWERDVKKYLELSMQITHEKTFPWLGAANVKYPIISTAAMQFAARAYPTLVPSNGNLVSVNAPAASYVPELQTQAHRISTFMSYQLLYEMKDWEEGMDNLLLILPIFGMAIKKVYYNPEHGTNCCEVVNPFNFVVNYWTECLEHSPRMTQVFYRDLGWIQEKVRAGIYRDVPLPQPTVTDNKKEDINVTKNAVPSDTSDYTTPYTLLEQHMYYDLDGDGYREPYIALIELESEKVLRLVPRFDQDSITFNEDGTVVKIDPDCYFVKYTFFPSPDGSFYTRGFGHMLGPINEAIDSVLNQLIDAGTMSNLQSGFLGKGLKLRTGDTTFRPGEWKQVNNVGSDLKANVFPLPTRDPSSVLFQLLSLLTQSAKELASVAEIFVGKMPGQNTPAYTTQQTIEQGMKLFTAIYKRVYRALTTEFRLLYKLNNKYLDENTYKEVLNDPQASMQDFNTSDRFLFPTADPQASSDFEKQQKFQQVGNLMQFGTIDPKAFTVEMLKGMGFDDKTIESLCKGAPAFNPQPKQPSPEEMKAQADIKATEAKTQATAYLTQQKVEAEQAKVAIKAKESEFNLAMKQMEATEGMKLERVKSLMSMQMDAAKSGVDLQAQQAKHALELLQSQETHQQNLQQTKQIGNAKVKAAAKQPKPKKETTK